ncbi:astacin-like metalloendopeptidase isoform X2 [Hyla sarda]|uniref:astacin-like metalloendopeptidase isoform X2 n=1 Tax=Hyla sarda TaxID=327740 RepID=UPI0024C3546D|nr:astacin-like metalloendopeptidase isoform X2 [Hyla sarda]
MHSRVLVCFLLLAFADTLPLVTRRPSDDPSIAYTEEEEIEDVFTQILRTNKDSTVKLFHGDIVMDRSYSALRCPECLWPKSKDGVVRVPYSLASDYSEDNKNLITAALETFTTLTCVHFMERTTEKDYLSIYSGSGCWSTIGKVGGAQSLSLMTPGCMAGGVVQHEMVHALGFYHEQSRSDRDENVDVMWQYINEGDWGNFELVDTDNMNLQYDYSSVMHYGKFSYSNTSGQPSLNPKPDESVAIGQRYGLSPLDVAKVKKLYDCDICSFLLIGINGSLDFDAFTSSYKNATSCIWLIRVNRNKAFLQFDSFDVPISEECSTYYITVYDGRSKKSPVLIDRMCGTHELPLMVASGNSLLVEFVYEAPNRAAVDLKASYGLVDCGGTYTTDNGTVTSPLYPDPYPNLSDCFTSIWAPEGYQIVLNFTFFDVEYSSACLYDYLLVFDGGRTDSPLLGRYCWNKPIPPVVSSGNALLLEFRSDHWFNMGGYTANYYFVQSS